MPDAPAPLDLSTLRGEIDRLDAEMHALLIQRGAIIEELIAVKKTSESGSAFRPGRESAVMKAIAERHRGILPLDTVESIWRVIIGTFTFVQAPYSVHADVSGGDAPMRDSARFHFGFTVPYVPHEGAPAVIAAVEGSRGDLGIFRIDQGASAGAWWRRLAAPQAPKIIARLPFIERPGHPAGTPVYVVSKPLADAAVREVVLYAVRVERWRDAAAEGIATLGGEIVCTTGLAGELSTLVAVPGRVEASDLVAALEASRAPVSEIVEVGSHAARLHLDDVAARAAAASRAAIS
ncbi:chorismate mutase [Salinarimonas rosea]|uniref:chorismate mutase n=1 Tax=Salinarimonas rosea TaxID=552063 RepID=UPI0004276A9C|nr:chorismate mutase [Salinarimonas rosea]